MRICNLVFNLRTSWHKQTFNIIYCTVKLVKQSYYHAYLADNAKLCRNEVPNEIISSKKIWQVKKLD